MVAGKAGSWAQVSFQKQPRRWGFFFQVGGNPGCDCGHQIDSSSRLTAWGHRCLLCWWGGAWKVTCHFPRAAMTPTLAWGLVASLISTGTEHVSQHDTLYIHSFTCHHVLMTTWAPWGQGLSKSKPVTSVPMWWAVWQGPLHPLTPVNTLGFLGRSQSGGPDSQAQRWFRLWENTWTGGDS